MVEHRLGHAAIDLIDEQIAVGRERVHAVLLGQKDRWIGHRPHQIGKRLGERAERRDRAVPGLDLARIDHRRQHDRLPNLVARDEWQRRRGHDRGDDRQLLRRRLRRLDERDDQVGRRR